MSERPISYRALFAVVYTTSIGAVYFSLGVVTHRANGLTPFVFLAAGLFFQLTAMTYTEGAGLHQERGGSSALARYAFNELVSFIAGWAILLDYLLMPALLFIFASVAMHIQIPANPQWVWVPVFVLIATLANLRGIAFTAWINMVGLYIQLAVIAVFAIAVAAAAFKGIVHVSFGPLFRKLDVL